MNSGARVDVFNFYPRPLLIECLLRSDLTYLYIRFFIWKMEKIILPTSQNYCHRKLSDLIYLNA